MTENDSEHTTWDKRKGEKPFWYERFMKYYLQGGRRSVLGASKRCATAEGRRVPTKLSGSWARAARDGDWEARGNDWAEDSVAREREEYDKAKVAAVKDVFSVYRNLMRKAAVELFNVDSPNFRNTGDAIKAIEVGARGILLMAGHATENIQASGEISGRLKVESIESFAREYATAINTAMQGGVEAGGGDADEPLESASPDDQSETGDVPDAS